MYIHIPDTYIIADSCDNSKYNKVIEIRNIIKINAIITIRFVRK